MKKLLYIAVFTILFLSGCEKKSAVTAPAALFELHDGETAAGIKIGDGSRAFIDAYRDYPLQVAHEDSYTGYKVMSVQEIPFKDDISIVIANFFIDDESVSEEQICKEYDWEEASLHSNLSAPAYLREHDVVYRYLMFSWENGKITDIVSDELNYNETFETPRLEWRALKK